MNLNYLKVFHTVAKHQGFTKAAEELLISQPTISVQIKNLEQELGLELFQKLGRKVYLTEAGRTLFHYTSKIFNQLEEAENALKWKSPSVAAKSLLIPKSKLKPSPMTNW